MKIIRGLCRFFTWLCMIIICALMLLMVSEVLSRLLFNRAILGSTEWAQVLLCCTMSAFGASILSNRQTRVDIVTSRLPAKVQVILSIFVLLITAVAVGILAWRQAIFALTSFRQHVFYNNIGLPQWPFVAVFALSYGIAAITTLCLVFRKIGSAIKGDWEHEAKLEEMDEIFVFGRKLEFAPKNSWDAGEENKEKGGEQDVT